MKTDQEIIEKYQTKIENAIKAFVEKYNITDSFYIERFSEEYKVGFI